MFTLNNMQVLYKESDLMESIMTHVKIGLSSQNTKIKLIVDGTKTYESAEVPIK